MRLTLVTAPSADPVDLVSAKRHCRVDHADDDDFIGSLIAAASNHIEGPSGILGRAIMPQTWLLELSGWVSSIVLPVEPVRSVSVAYTDANGEAQTLAADQYSLSAWPSAATTWRFVDDAVRPVLDAVEYPVRITIEAGFASADAVPEPLKVAILMLVGHWYGNREAVIVGTSSAPTSMAFDALIAPFRRLV